MKTVELYKKNNSEYVEVCSFAKRIYEEQLSFTITDFPEYFFAIKDEARIVGCIGLNSSLTSPLFLNDERVLKVIRETGCGVRFCEQSIFAIDHYNLGVPLLIAVVTEYAHSVGAHKLVYAGIDVSRKTIARLGFSVTECGPVDLTLLPSADRKKYELWNKTQNPVTCILDTKKASLISHSVFNRHSHRVKKSESLNASLLANHAKLQQEEICSL